MRTVLIPADLPELLEVRRSRPEALLLSGGTDLLVALRRAPAPEDIPLLWIGKVAGLQGVRRDGDWLEIGAATTFAALLADPLIRRHAPLLAQAAGTLGAPAVRNMATIGGNLCTASPAGDALPPLYVMDAEVELASGQKTRRLPIADFITGPRKTALAPGELLTRIRLPIADDTFRYHFEKVGRRRSLAIAVASLAAMARLSGSGDGPIAEIRLAWGSVGPTVVRLPEVEKRLTGKPLDPDLIRSAAEDVRRAVAPIDDIRAPAGYRRAVAGNLLIRFLEALHG